MTQRVLRGHMYSGAHIKGFQISCVSCDEKSAVIVWDDRYAGYRGRCKLCQNDWVES